MNTHVENSPIPKANKIAKDARKATLIFQQAEEAIKAVRSSDSLEYVDYVGKVEAKSAGKMGFLTGISALGGLAGAVNLDLLPPSLEILGMGVILAGGATGMYKAYSGSSLSTFLSPFAMIKARKKQAIEDKVRYLFLEEKRAEEQAILASIKPLITELNYSLKKINREIHYSPAIGQFRLKDSRDNIRIPSYMEENQPSLSLPKWDNIYVLATSQGKKLKMTHLPFHIVEVTPEIFHRKNLSIEESIAILRHTENAIKKALSKTSTGEEYRKTTDPSDHEYIKEENSLVAKAQTALETINRAIDPVNGKLVYSAGTRFPNFNLSTSRGERKLTKWENMEQAIQETMALGRITSLKALKTPKAPQVTGKP